jgi:hypothetical protein
MEPANETERLDGAVSRSNTPRTMTTRIVRLSALAIGLFVAAPALASVSPLCGDDKGHDDKAKSENKEKNEKKKEDEKNKKPVNPA